MNKELCFNIDTINLYMEQILVDYLDIPIFFLCSGDKQYYIALCTDIEDLKYIVVKLASVDVYNLLHGEIPMRDIILKQSEYWDIVSGEDIGSDIVIKKKMDEIENTLLPEEKAYFKILTKEMQAYVERFDSEFLSSEYFYKSDKKIDVNEMMEIPFFDDISENIDQYLELLDYKIQKSLFSKLPLYDEQMNSIEKAEGTFRNSEQIELVQVKDCYYLNKDCVNNLAFAA